MNPVKVKSTGLTRSSLKAVSAMETVRTMIFNGVQIRDWRVVRNNRKEPREGGFWLQGGIGPEIKGRRYGPIFWAWFQDRRAADAACDLLRLSLDRSDYSLPGRE